MPDEHALSAPPTRSVGAQAAARARSAVLALAVSLLALAGCTSLPTVDRQAIASEAIPLSAATTLGRIATAYVPAPDQSGFRLMPLGKFSLDTRVQLARRAEVSLDVQYYHFENDETGRWLLRALRDAANRGVRVRLLIDDFYTSGNDELFLAFAAHKNVEVRHLQPVLRRARRRPGHALPDGRGDWKRVNHRMHNKLFIADGAMAVIGGRNVANEYFLRSTHNDNFIDVDAFTVGWVVPPLQGLFDRYWNADAVYPIDKVMHTPLSPDQLRARFEEWTGPRDHAAAGAAAAHRHPRLRPDRRRPRRRPARPDLGRGLCVRRPPRQAVRRRGRRRAAGHQRHLQRVRGASARPRATS